MSRQSVETQKADPAARRRVLLIVVVAAVAGALVVSQVQRYIKGLGDLSRDDPAEALTRLVSLLKLISVSGAVALSLLGAWMWRFWSRVATTQRFPPPGQAVVRDVRVLHGPAAQKRARLGQVLSAALIGSGIVLVVVTWRIAIALSRAAAV